MGFESAGLSYLYRSVSATARLLPFALTAPENSNAQQRAEGEVVVAAFGCEGGMGFAYSFAGMRPPKEGAW
jgi:hypothetical protein